MATSCCSRQYHMESLLLLLLLLPLPLPTAASSFQHSPLLRHQQTSTTTVDWPTRPPPRDPITTTTTTATTTIATASPATTPCGTQPHFEHFSNTNSHEMCAIKVLNTLQSLSATDGVRAVPSTDVTISLSNGGIQGSQYRGELRLSPKNMLLSSSYSIFATSSPSCLHNNYLLHFRSVPPGVYQLTVTLTDTRFARYYLPADISLSNSSGAHTSTDTNTDTNTNTHRVTCNGTIGHSFVSSQNIAMLAAETMNYVVPKCKRPHRHPSLIHVVAPPLPPELSSTQQEVKLIDQIKHSACSSFPSMPNAGHWVSSACLASGCRTGDATNWVTDKYLWKPDGCWMQYMSRADVVSMFEHMNITTVLLLGDSRTRGLFAEVIEFFRGNSQMWNPQKPFPLVLGNGKYPGTRYGLANPKFEESPSSNDYVHRVMVSTMKNNPTNKKTHDEQPKTMQNYTFRFSMTAGEFLDHDMQHCFQGDSTNTRGYLKWRDTFGVDIQTGPKVVHNELKKDGDSVDLVVWTAGIHNAHCFWSNQQYRESLMLETEEFVRWMQRGQQVGKTKVLLYRSIVGRIATLGHFCEVNERLKEFNQIAREVLLELKERVRGFGSVVFLPGMLDMSVTRPDRSYDAKKHYYPCKYYKTSPAAFPRLVSSEMLLMVLTQLKQLENQITKVGGMKEE